MKKNNIKNKGTATTIGSNKTAALANIMELQPGSNVSIPSIEDVEEAKDWVDSNEK